MDVADLLEATAARGPERTCLTWGDDGSATYGEVAAAVDAQARVLRAALPDGGRVAVLSPNRPDLVVVWLACMRAQLTPVFLNPALTDDELGLILDDLGPALVVGDRAAADRRLPAMTVLDDVPSAGPVTPAVVAASGLRDAVPPAAVVLTSGSTGRPKYVPVSQAAYLLKGALNAQFLGWSAADHAFCAMPLFHVGAQTETLLPAIAAGASVHLVPSFSASTLWTELERVGATHFHATSSLLAMALARGAAATPNRLARVVGALRADLVERLRELLPASDLITVYGLSECPLGSLGVPGEEYRAGWIGVPYLPSGLRVADAGGCEVPAGEQGEIQLRNAACTPGYLGVADDGLFTADGWLRTGDIGYRADGGLYLAGRSKEMVRRSGENIAPAEIESAAMRHPGVVEAAAVPFPDPIREEEVRLFVEPHPGLRPDPAELRAFLGGHLARFKLPRYVDIVAELPRTASNKPDKAALCDRFPVPQWDADAGLEDGLAASPGRC